MAEIICIHHPRRHGIAAAHRYLSKPREPKRTDRFLVWGMVVDGALLVATVALALVVIGGR